MVRCKAREILRNEAGLLSAATTKDECDAAAGCLSTASTRIGEAGKQVKDRRFYV